MDESPRERWARVTSDPKYPEVIASHVAGGGSLMTVAEALGVPIHWIFEYMRGDKANSDLLNKAYIDNNEAHDAMWIREVATLAYSDLTDAFDESNALLPMKKLPKNVARAIQSVKVKELFDEAGQKIGTTTEVKLWSKEKALEMIGRNKQKFIDKLEVTGKVTLEDMLAAVHKELTSGQEKENQTSQDAKA